MLLPSMAVAAPLVGATYEQGGYTATKISHPESGLGETDGIVDLEDDSADRGQSYSWSSVGYGDWMYVGTCYAAMASTLKKMASQMGTTYDVLSAGIDALFNGNLFLDSADAENRSLLLKINTRTGEVKVVVEPTSGTNGYRAAVEFHDKLYFAASANPEPYLLEVDPATDETKIVYTAPSVPQGQAISVGIRGLTVLNDQLISSMIGEDGAYIVASSDPSAGQDSFRTIGTQEDLLDYPAYHYTDSIFGGSIWDMVGFNGKLYITVVTGKNGAKQSFALFCGEPGADGQWTYRLLVGDTDDGARYTYGFGADRSGAANLAVYGDHLYIGGYNDPMVALPDALSFEFESIYKDLSSPVNLWRMDANEKFEMVAGEANEAFPEGPIGTLNGKSLLAGLGTEDDASRNLNQYVWNMREYDGKLYAGTFDIGSLAYPLMQFTNGDVLDMTADEWKSQIRYIKEFLEALKEQQSGDEAAAIAEDGIGVAAEGEPDADSDGDADADESDDLTATAEALAEEGSVDSVIADLESMESLMSAMQGDLDSAQGDESEVSPLSLDDSASTYTLDDRMQFEDWLQSLLDTYQKVHDYLPESLTSVLDQWLNQENVDNFSYFVGTCQYLSQGERGFDLLVSSDGTTFQTITRDGFGDANNHGLRVFAATNTGLNIGTANPYQGSQIWTLSDGSVIEDSVLEQTEYEYDKYAGSDQHKPVDVRIDLKGNTVSEVRYNHAALTKDVDYTITDDGIQLATTFLDGLDTGAAASFQILFNVGARASFTVAVTDTTPGTPGTDVPADADGSQSEAIGSTGSSVVAIVAAIVVLAAAAVVLIVLRRRKK
ncbi:hypothetical protein BL8807_04465 [Bifidobacterium lemurum]|nr:hypothetical protein BL8807_04465 [Bifidobacterium lemurum]